jgi:hypothetical protein
MELATVNKESDRNPQRLWTGHSRAAVSQVLARRIARGQDMSIEGTVIELWDPSDAAIAQVGLIADDTGKIKFTALTASQPAIVQ